MSSERLSVKHEDDTQQLRRAFTIALCFALFLWLIKLMEMLLTLDLAQYGVYPGRLSGLVNVLWAPLIHGSLSHLFANTAPIIVLGTALLYGYPKSARIVLLVVYFGTGLGVWLFARQSYHIGASGLSFGMMFFLFVIGVLRWDKRAIAISMVVFFLYGSMVWGILPGNPGISYESHLFGAVIGVILAFFLKKRDPAPPKKQYSWEGEEEDANESVVSDFDAYKCR